MALLGPHPRLRLYTRSSDYARVAFEMASQQWLRGDSVAQLEEQLAARLNTRFAVALPMARVAIYHAVRALIKPGQKVILSPYTIADVVNMVICAGGIPVFADIDAATCNIRADEVERLIDDATGAVLVTHFYGCVCDVHRIAEICRARRVPLIEDAAQAFGAMVDGQPAGTIGDAGIFSFGLYKNVCCFYGGLVVTNREDVHQAVSASARSAPPIRAGHLLNKVISGAITDTITWPPIFSTVIFRIFRYGYLNDVDAINNRLKIDVDPKKKTQLPDDYVSQLSPLQARLIGPQLKSVDAKTEARLRAAQRYHNGLQDLDQLGLPPLRQDKSHVYWYYPIQYAPRQELVKYAMRQGRDLAESHHRNCADLECFAEYHRDCPVARSVAQSVIYLPTYPSYPVSEIEKTIAVIRRFFGR